MKKVVDNALIGNTVQDDGTPSEVTFDSQVVEDIEIAVNVQVFCKACNRQYEGLSGQYNGVETDVARNATTEGSVDVRGLNRFS